MKCNTFYKNTVHKWNLKIMKMLHSSVEISYNKLNEICIVTYSYDMNSLFGLLLLSS